MNDICPDYQEDQIWFRDKRRTICAYWDLDNHGLCKHDNHNVCLIYLNKKNINNPWLIKFMDDFGCVLV